MTYATRAGESKPLGATVNDDGVNFSIFSQHATDVDLLLFADPTQVEPAQVVRLAARTLYFWHVQVDGLPKNTSYAFRFHGPGTPADTQRFGHRFNSNKVLIDPYGRANLRKLWVASFTPLSTAPQRSALPSSSAVSTLAETQRRTSVTASPFGKLFTVSVASRIE